MQTGAVQFFQLSNAARGAPQRIGRSQIFASGGRLIRTLRCYALKIRETKHLLAGGPVWCRRR